MRKLFTVIGTKKDGYDNRYIQLGNSGRPVIQTRTGYRARNVILFTDDSEAYKFLYLFNKDRNINDIDWKVVEYHSSPSSDTLVGMISDTNGRSSYEQPIPGEVRVRWNGKLIVSFYKRRGYTYDGENVYYYARTND